MDARRTERVSEALREELEEVIGYELADPRIDVTSITEVLISPDARHAHVRVDIRGDADHQRRTLDALNAARSFLKGEMSRRLHMFRVPELHFEPAIDAELGSKAHSLLRRVRRGRPRDENFPEEKTSK